jgi:hypothetical protein
MFRTRWALATLLAGCLVGACSDDDPKPDLADPTPSVSSTAPTEASTSPTTTATPPLNPEGTVQAWVSAWNMALQTGDAATLRQYETPDCRNCPGLASLIEDVTAAGGSFTGGEWSIVNSKVIEISDHRVKVNVAMAVAEGSTTNSAGEDPVQFDSDKRIVVYELEHTSAAWLIDVIELLS